LTVTPAGALVPNDDSSYAQAAAAIVAAATSCEPVTQPARTACESSTFRVTAAARDGDGQVKALAAAGYVATISAGYHSPLTVTPAGTLASPAAALLAQLATSVLAAVSNCAGVRQPVKTVWVGAGLAAVPAKAGVAVGTATMITAIAVIRNLGAARLTGNLLFLKAVLAYG
jgi:hypothetical protein